MRYAIISDIHANLQAWNAVLLDIRALRADRIICLGDIVGYGPNPAQVLQSVHSNVDHFVLGNHDAVICGKLDPSLFNPTACEVIRWTQAQLGKNAFTFLRQLPLTLAGEGFRCAHADFSRPASFRYVVEPDDALPSWSAVDDSLLFVGHTHRPAIHILGQSRTPKRVGPQDFVVEDLKRFLVNVGSVGQPRDGEARASYCILDTVSRAVYWRRLPFDLDAYKAALKVAGLPEDVSGFLKHDPRLATQPLRELLVFSPPEDDRRGVQDTVEVATLDALHRRVARWKVLSGLILCVSLAAAGATVALWWRFRTRALDQPPRSPHAIHAATIRPQSNALPPLPKPGAGSLADNWGLHLGNRRRQHVVLIQTDSGPGLRLSSADSGSQLTVVSRPVRVIAGLSMRVEGLFKKLDNFTGTVACAVVMTSPAGETKELVVNPNLRRKQGWLKAQQTFTVPAGIQTVHLHVRGRFAGTVVVRDLALIRK